MTDDHEPEDDHSADFEAADAALLQSFNFAIHGMPSPLSMPEADYHAEWIRRRWLLLEAMVQDIPHLARAADNLPEMRRVEEWRELRNLIVEQLEKYDPQTAETNDPPC